MSSSEPSSNYILTLLDLDKEDYEEGIIIYDCMLMKDIKKYIVNEYKNNSKFRLFSYDIEWGYLLPYDSGTTDHYYKVQEVEKDIIEMSLKFPDVVFELDRKVEFAGDYLSNWKKYFKNGKIQICPVKIKYNSFDEKKLKHF